MIPVNDLAEITEDDIENLVQLITPELESRKQLWKRIHRKENLSNIVFDTNGKKNNIAFEKYIWLIASGFLGGKAPIYTVNDTADEKKANLIKEVLEKAIEDKDYKSKMEMLIDYISKFNDDDTEHYDLICDALGLRGAYELIYENESNEIVYARLDPLQTVAIWDYKVPCNLIGLVQIYNEQDAKGTTREIVKITDKNGTRKYLKSGKAGSKEKIKGKVKYTELKEDYENHNWGDVPAFAVELDESIFESVVDTVLKYEQLIQNTSNMFQYNDEAKLAIYGYQAENPMVKQIEQVNEKGETEYVDVENPARVIEDERVMKSKTFYFPDKSQAGAEWIEKNINDSAIQNTLKTYIDLILMMAGVPNTFDLGFTNADNASAIDRKFFSLAMITTKMLKQFKKGYLRRWELIFGRINIKKNTKYDFRDIAIELPSNLPANESEVIDMWLKVRGLASDETIIERLPLGLDYTSESNKIEAQNERNIENNLKNMEKMGQNVDGATLNTGNSNKQFEVKEDDGKIVKEEEEQVKELPVEAADKIQRRKAAVRGKAIEDKE